jgi:protein TonB
MLLATWVGEVPISSRFKREILGKETPPKETVALFTQAVPSAARKQEVAQALSQSAATVVAATAVVAPKAVSAPAPAAKPAPVKAEAVKTASVQPKPVTPEPKVAKVEPKVVKPAPAPAVKNVVKAPAAPATVAAAKAEKPKAEPEKVATPAAPTQVAKVAPQHEELSEEEEARRLLLRQEYLKGLNRDINTYKHLPPAAFSKRAEGSVRLAITLDKNGKLLKVEVVEPSRHSMFNEQALQAVSEAQPFSPPPSELESDPFEFETTLYYDLPL